MRYNLEYDEIVMSISNIEDVRVRICMKSKRTISSPKQCQTEPMRWNIYYVVAYDHLSHFYHWIVLDNGEIRPSIFGRNSNPSSCCKQFFFMSLLTRKQSVNVIIASGESVVMPKLYMQTPSCSTVSSIEILFINRRLERADITKFSATFKYTV